MNRLNFILPDFTRLAWTSQQAREVWGPRISAIARAWNHIEWMSISASVRRCAIVVVTPEQFIQSACVWAEHGVYSVPLEIQGLSRFSYSSTPVTPKTGSPYGFRVVLGQHDSLPAFQSAWRAADHRQIGDLLGFPECCTRFFDEVWIQQRCVDTTWAMAQSSKYISSDGATTVVSGAPPVNILWRWVGVRAVPHLPCSFDCDRSLTLATNMINVGKSLGYDKEMDWLFQVLSWPVEWSGMHGIAEIKTPILKVSTRTDATSSKYVVRWTGSDVPVEGANGVRFPFRVGSGRLVSLTLPQRQNTTHNDLLMLSRNNGFSSARAMDDAHGPVVKLAVRTLAGRGSVVLDLGCGNGLLLDKIHKSNPTSDLFGIDSDALRIAHARHLLPLFVDNFFVGDMFRASQIWERKEGFDLVLLMPGRLLENAQAKEMLLSHIRAKCRHVLAYAYGDWLRRYGDLRGLCQHAGLELIQFTDSEPSVGLVRV